LEIDVAAQALSLPVARVCETSARPWLFPAIALRKQSHEVILKERSHEVILKERSHEVILKERSD
jgi:hypothetical protein